MCEGSAESSTASGVPLQLLPKEINGVRVIGIDVPGFGVPTHAEAKDVLAGMPPFLSGGSMIETVTMEATTYAPAPQRFEAGTPHIAGGICLGKAFEFLSSIDMEAAEKHERELAKYAEDMLDTFEGLQIIGEAKNKTSVVSFAVKGIHPFDIGTLLDKQGIAVRTGHHCTQPLMDFYQIPGTIRASFAFYNTKEEIDAFVEALQKVVNMLA